MLYFQNGWPRIYQLLDGGAHMAMPASTQVHSCPTVAGHYPLSSAHEALIIQYAGHLSLLLTMTFAAHEPMKGIHH